MNQKRIGLLLMLHFQPIRSVAGLRRSIM